MQKLSRNGSRMDDMRNRDREMIVRVPGAFLEHSRAPKPPKIDQKYTKNLCGVPRWGSLLIEAAHTNPARRTCFTGSPQDSR